MSTRHLVRLALLVTLVFGAQARFLTHVPGDPALAHAVQAMAPGTAWVAPFVGTASAPFKYGLMAIAVLGAWRLASTTSAPTVTAYSVMNVDGNDSPLGLPITATSARDGRGRPKRPFDASPSVCSSAMAAMTTSAARRPARRHAPSTAIAIRPYLNGALAVPTSGATHAVPGAMAWTACASAGSPGR